MNMEKYKKTRLKLTPQRLAILDYLDGNQNHPSAEEIYRDVSKSFPTMSFATIYNTLEALRKQGSVLELTIDPDKKRFDPNTEIHHHLICTSCRRIEDVHTRFDLDIPGTCRNGFEVTGNHVEFYGICPACNQKPERCRK
jgi:Fur family peroxide stress response transcriptional regulator